MTAPLRSRSFVAIALAAALVPLPSHAAPAATAAAPTTAAPAAAAPTAAPTTSSPTPTEAPAPTDAGTPTDAPPTDAPPEGGEVPVDSVPVEEKTEPEKTEEPPPAVPEGPERPAEPTLGNGKFKAKGTGLMIAGGTLFGLGAVGVVTTVLLTRCTELDNSFGCKNQHNNTFAVPATATVALLGAVLLAVGVTYRLRYRRWESWDPKRAKTAFYPAISPNSVGLGTIVKF